ncbi:MAG: MBL fold metallo-hydrolase [Bacteroidota bacterium]|nr:MBL fold metallo-hydrolase [Bacteroidota bacterium]
MIEIKSFTFNDYQENTYVLSNRGKCIVIDPGNYSTEENNEIKDYINNNKLSLKYILVTHCHIDHVLGIEFLCKEFSVDVYIPSSEVKFYNEIKNYAPLFGFNNYNHYDKVKFIDESKSINFEKNTIQILSLPGHSVGHLGFYLIEEKICFSGDVVFKNSIGRTDLPGGNYETLIDSIKNKLFLLEDSVTIYPGHGPVTNIKDEKIYNPFLN